MQEIESLTYESKTWEYHRKNNVSMEKTTKEMYNPQNGSNSIFDTEPHFEK